MSKLTNIKRIISLAILFVFSATVLLPTQVSAQTLLSAMNPVFAQPVSVGIQPVLIKGVKIYPQNPLRLDFIVDQGSGEVSAQKVKFESQKLIKYFLAAVTTPEKDMWVNLSPVERDRIVPKDFGQTEMGRDLLAQDYLLKQLTSALLHPDGEVGGRFWQQLKSDIESQTGRSDVPLEIFNKIWITPKKAVVYERGTHAFVAEASLQIMFENHTDQFKNRAPSNQEIDNASNDAMQQTLSADIIRKEVLPMIEYEINHGAVFAPLRQIFHSLILATWYKRKLQASVLGEEYVDRNRIAGVDIADENEKYKIYEQYLQAFKSGAFNYIKEEYDPKTQEIKPTKYFSGGAGMQLTNKFQVSGAESVGAQVDIDHAMVAQVSLNANDNRGRIHDKAMLIKSEIAEALEGLPLGHIIRLDNGDDLIISRNKKQAGGQSFIRMKYDGQVFEVNEESGYNNDQDSRLQASVLGQHTMRVLINKDIVVDINLADLMPIDENYKVDLITIKNMSEDVLSDFKFDLVIKQNSPFLHNIKAVWSAKADLQYLKMNNVFMGELYDSGYVDFSGLGFLTKILQMINQRSSGSVPIMITNVQNDDYINIMSQFWLDIKKNPLWQKEVNSIPKKTDYAIDDAWGFDYDELKIILDKNGRLNEFNSLMDLELRKTAFAKPFINAEFEISFVKKGNIVFPKNASVLAIPKGMLEKPNKEKNLKLINDLLEEGVDTAMLAEQSIASTAQIVREQVWSAIDGKSLANGVLLPNGKRLWLSKNKKVNNDGERFIRVRYADQLFEVSEEKGFNEENDLNFKATVTASNTMRFEIDQDIILDFSIDKLQSLNPDVHVDRLAFKMISDKDSESFQVKIAFNDELFQEKANVAGFWGALKNGDPILSLWSVYMEVKGASSIGEDGFNLTGLGFLSSLLSAINNGSDQQVRILNNFIKNDNVHASVSEFWENIRKDPDWQKDLSKVDTKKGLNGYLKFDYRRLRSLLKDNGRLVEFDKLLNKVLAQTYGGKAFVNLGYRVKFSTKSINKFPDNSSFIATPVGMPDLSAQDEAMLINGANFSPDQIKGKVWKASRSIDQELGVVINSGQFKGGAQLYSRADVNTVLSNEGKYYSLSDKQDGSADLEDRTDNLSDKAGAQFWPIDNTPLADIDNYFGIIETITEQAMDNPNQEFLVLDWGCGSASALIELGKYLQEMSFTNVKLFGFSYDAYPSWHTAPDNITFILDERAHLINYYNQGIISGKFDHIISYSGLVRMDEYLVDADGLVKHFQHLRLMLNDDGDIRSTLLDNLFEDANLTKDEFLSQVGFELLPEFKQGYSSVEEHDHLKIADVVSDVDSPINDKALLVNQSNFDDGYFSIDEVEETEIDRQLNAFTAENSRLARSTRVTERLRSQLMESFSDDEAMLAAAQQFSDEAMLVDEIEAYHAFSIYRNVEVVDSSVTKDDYSKLQFYEMQEAVVPRKDLFSFKAVFGGQKYLAKAVYLNDARGFSEAAYINNQIKFLAKVEALEIEGVQKIKKIVFAKMPNGQNVKVLLLEDLSVSRPGRTLMDVILDPSKELNPVAALRLLIKIADIVEELFVSDIYHWDLLPQNIWVTDDGDVVLINTELLFSKKGDFFSMKRHLEGNKFYAQNNRLSVMYENPEQITVKKIFNGDVVIEHEIFSLISMLATLVYGQERLSGVFNAYEENGKNPLLMNRFKASVLLDEKYETKIPAPMKKMLLKAFEIGASPYPTINEFIADLRVVLKDSLSDVVRNVKIVEGEIEATESSIIKQNEENNQNIRVARDDKAMLVDNIEQIESNQYASDNVDSAMLSRMKSIFPGQGVGILRVFGDVETYYKELWDIKDNEIVAINYLPIEDPMRNRPMGIITSSQYSRLNHAASTAEVLKLPYAQIDDLNALSKFKDEWVFLDTKDEKSFIRLATLDEQINYRIKIPKLIQPELEKVILSTEKNILHYGESDNYQEVSRKFSSLYELKAAQEWHFDPVLKKEVPSFQISFGSVIPYAVNRKVIDANVGVEEEMRKIEASIKFSDIDDMREKLESIQQLILNLKFPASMWGEVNNSDITDDVNNFGLKWEIYKEFAGKKLFVRLGTPAEDSDLFPGFGVGKYLSLPNVNLSNIESSIKQVWASIWSQGAYVERVKANVDHFDVLAATQLVEAVDAKYSFVVRTGDPNYEDFDKVFIDILQGQGSGINEMYMEGFPHQYVYSISEDRIVDYQPATLEDRLILNPEGGLLKVGVESDDIFLQQGKESLLALDIARQSLNIKQVKNRHQDIEGAIIFNSENKAYEWTVVQSRAQVGYEEGLSEYESFEVLHKQWGVSFLEENINVLDEVVVNNKFASEVLEIIKMKGISNNETRLTDKEFSFLIRFYFFLGEKGRQMIGKLFLSAQGMHRLYKDAIDKFSNSFKAKILSEVVIDYKSLNQENLELFLRNSAYNLARIIILYDQRTQKSIFGYMIPQKLAFMLEEVYAYHIKGKNSWEPEVQWKEIKSSFLEIYSNYSNSHQKEFIMNASPELIKALGLKSGDDQGEKGGIDFDASKWDLDVTGQGVDFALPDGLIDFSNFTGFSPVIIHMSPLTNLPLLLGLEIPDDNSPDVEREILALGKK